VEKRQLSDGALSASFGQGGVALSAAAPASVASAVSLRDGVLFTAGSEGVEDLRLEARDSESGALLYAVTEDFTDAGCGPQCVALAAGDQDDLYVAAMAGGRWRVERRSRSLGTLVYAQELEPDAGCDGASSLAVHGGALYVAGFRNERWRIEKRSLADGELVASFGQGGVVEPGVRGAASAVALQDEVLYVAGIEGPRRGVQSSVWRVERRSAADGALLPCPQGAPEVPRAPDCAGRPVVTDVLPVSAGECTPRVATSSACAAANVRADTAASSLEDWVLPEGAVLADEARARVGLAGEPSSLLLLRGFGFSLPEHARVQGITVEVTRAGAQPASVADHAVRLVKDGRILDGDRSLAGAWEPSLTRASHGGPDDVWDAAWTPAELNDPSFGVALRARALQGGEPSEAQLDAVRVAVHYCDQDAP
jgi:hypothetical protein